MEVKERNFIEMKIFWDNVLKPENKLDYVEIRFNDGDKPREYYEAVRELLRQNPNIICRKYTQFFIREFNELYTILTFANSYLLTYYKCCYALAHRRFKDVEQEDKSIVNDIGGGYQYIDNIRLIFFDIELKGHNDVTADTDKLLDDYISKTFVPYMKRYKLDYPIIIHSGGGRHVLYKVKQTPFTEARNRWIKSFYTEVSNKLTDDFIKVDILADATRIFGIPGSMNVRRKKFVRLLASSFLVNGDFVIKSEKLPKIIASKNVNIDMNTPFENSLEWQILINNAEQGDRHQILLFANKLLLKALNIQDYRKYEVIVNSIYGGKCSLNPNNGTRNKFYNKGIIINYCKKHDAWLKQFPDLVFKLNQYIEIYKEENKK